MSSCGPGDARCRPLWFPANVREVVHCPAHAAGPEALERLEERSKALHDLIREVDISQRSIHHNSEYESCTQEPCKSDRELIDAGKPTGGALGA